MTGQRSRIGAPWPITLTGFALTLALMVPAPALAAPPYSSGAPARARAINGQESVGFNGAGFNSGGFNQAGFNSPGFSRPGFNGAGFNSGGPIGRGGIGEGCGRMLVPAASLGTMSRGFFPGHAGLDLAAAHGSSVKAAASGTISFMGTDPDYGLFIDIRHPGGLLTRYGHLSAFAPGLYAGTAVRGGMEIGKVGATGNAQGAHLHFEVRASGRAVDPKPFLTGGACSRAPAGEELLEARAPEHGRQPGR